MDGLFAIADSSLPSSCSGYASLLPSIRLAPPSPGEIGPGFQGSRLVLSAANHEQPNSASSEAAGRQAPKIVNSRRLPGLPSRNGDAVTTVSTAVGYDTSVSGLITSKSTMTMYSGNLSTAVTGAAHSLASSPAGQGSAVLDSGFVESFDASHIDADTTLDLASSSGGVTFHSRLTAAAAPAANCHTGAVPVSPASSSVAADGRTTFGHTSPLCATFLARTVPQPVATAQTFGVATTAFLLPSPSDAGWTESSSPNSQRTHSIQGSVLSSNSSSSSSSSPSAQSETDRGKPIYRTISELAEARVSSNGQPSGDALLPMKLHLELLDRYAAYATELQLNHEQQLESVVDSLRLSAGIGNTVADVGVDVLLRQCMAMLRQSHQLRSVADNWEGCLSESRHVIADLREQVLLLSSQLDQSRHKCSSLTQETEEQARSLVQLEAQCASHDVAQDRQEDIALQRHASALHASLQEHRLVNLALEERCQVAVQRAGQLATQLQQKQQELDSCRVSQAELQRMKQGLAQALEDSQLNQRVLMRLLPQYTTLCNELEGAKVQVLEARQQEAKASEELERRQLALEAATAENERLKSQLSHLGVQTHSLMLWKNRTQNESSHLGFGPDFSLPPGHVQSLPFTQSPRPVDAARSAAAKSTLHQSPGSGRLTQQPFPADIDPMATVGVSYQRPELPGSTSPSVTRPEQRRETVADHLVRQSHLSTSPRPSPVEPDDLFSACHYDSRLLPGTAEAYLPATTTVQEQEGLALPPLFARGPAILGSSRRRLWQKPASLHLPNTLPGGVVGGEEAAVDTGTSETPSSQPDVLPSPNLSPIDSQDGQLVEGGGAVVTSATPFLPTSGLARSPMPADTAAAVAAASAQKVARRLDFNQSPDNHEKQRRLKRRSAPASLTENATAPRSLYSTAAGQRMTSMENPLVAMIPTHNMQPADSLTVTTSVSGLPHASTSPQGVAQELHHVRASQPSGLREDRSPSRTVALSPVLSSAQRLAAHPFIAWGGANTSHALPATTQPSPLTTMSVSMSNPPAAAVAVGSQQEAISSAALQSLSLQHAAGSIPPTSSPSTSAYLGPSVSHRSGLEATASHGHYLDIDPHTRQTLAAVQSRAMVNGRTFSAWPSLEQASAPVHSGHARSQSAQASLGLASPGLSQASRTLPLHQQLLSGHVEQQWDAAEQEQAQFNNLLREKTMLEAALCKSAPRTRSSILERADQEARLEAVDAQLHSVRLVLKNLGSLKRS